MQIELIPASGTARRLSKEKSMTLATSNNVERVTRSQSAAEPVRYALDASHSHVGFSVRHMMITNVRGEFTTLSGEVSYDPNHPEATRVEVTVDPASVNTREEKRDAHLRSADFFDVEQYPKITFSATQTKKRGDSLEVKGNLTIRDTTREVTLAVDNVTPEHADPWGARRIGASARTKIKRSDFGMQWNAALEAGGVLVGDEITLEIDVSLVRK
jgi:polyisoprenoid-binding protein YceI